jgi:tetratricopeptide (TPR) repeat protein
MAALLCPQETELSHDAVVQQLERILADRRFASSERNSGFLRYVVTRTLEGRADEIKEIVVATELYGRSSDYDPKVDSIVRVEATRLRSKLQSYYEQEGNRDPVRITVPKGTYVPRFERFSAPEMFVAEPENVLLIEPSTAAPPIEKKPPFPLRWLWAALFVVGLTVLLSTWSWGAPGNPHAEALTAWQEGNQLLALDPSSGQSDRGAPQTLRRAIERYEFAVAKDPSFARAWASLAEAYDYAFPYVDRDQNEDGRRAEATARRAIALDNKLAYGHAMLGLVLSKIKWDFAGAEAAYRRAIELDPRNPWAIVEYTDLLRETGRVEQAAAEIRQARALLPLLPVLAWAEAEIQLDQQRMDAAIATATAAIQLTRDYRRAHVALGTGFEMKGEFERALGEYRAALAMNAQDRRALPAYGHLLALMGRKKDAEEVLRQLQELNSRIRNCAFQIAVVYTGLGDHDRALEWLERAYQTHQVHTPFAGVEPRFRPLHRYPRFQAIVNRIGVKVISR